MNYSKIKKNLYFIIDNNKTWKDYSLKCRQNINKLLDQLLNPNYKKVYCLSELETYILRKVLYVFQYKTFENYNDKFFDDEIFEKAEIDHILILPKMKLRKAIYEGINFKNELDGMTSFIPLELERCYVSDLNLDLPIEKILFRNNIITLHDLLTFSKRDLLKIRSLGDSKIDCIEKKLRKLGLRFLDDLGFLEKQEIIARSDDNTIFNSSMYWIDGIKKDLVTTICGCSPFSKLKDLTEYQKENGISNDYIEAAKLIGIDLLNQKKMVYYDINNLNKITLNDINLPKLLLFVLNHHNINLVIDLLKLDEESLKNILFNNENYFNQTLNAVHKMGLYFQFESRILMSYSNEIQKVLKK